MNEKEKELELRKWCVGQVRFSKPGHGWMDEYIILAERLYRWLNDDYSESSRSDSSIQE